MTNEEAIKQIEAFRTCMIVDDAEPYVVEALNMAVEALEQEPCEDAISRQEVLYLVGDYDLSMGQVVKGIHALPPVAPQQKYGKWIKHPEIETSAPEYLMFYECSECGDKQCFCKSDLHKKRFCNSCGAKMQKVRNKE